MSGRLSRRRSFARRQSLNPMESIVNLIDIMLIFACGLMVSIAMLWGLDMSMDEQEAGYQDLGHVYVDPDSGRTYIVTPADTDTSGLETSQGTGNE